MKLNSSLMRVLPLSLLFIILAGCQNVTSQKTVSRKTETTYRVNPINGHKEVQSSITQDSLFINKEYMDWDSVKINGQLPFIARVTDLYTLLGQPDSVITADTVDNCGYYYYDKNLKIAYINGTEVEFAGDSGIVRIIDFKNNPETYLQTPKIKLDRNTTLDALKKVFPDAVKAQASEGSGKTISVRLEISKHPMDDAWVLFFKNNRLVRIDYYVPC